MDDGGAIRSSDFLRATGMVEILRLLSFIKCITFPNSHFMVKLYLKYSTHEHVKSTLLSTRHLSNSYLKLHNSQLRLLLLNADPSIKKKKYL